MDRKIKPLGVIPALVISVTIWLVSNLSQTSTAPETMYVLVHSNIEGRYDAAREEVPVVASVTATGFRHIKLSGTRKPVDVFIDWQYLESDYDEFFIIPNSTVFRYASDIFGQGVSVQSVISDRVRVRFPEEYCKKVPVVPVTLISYRPQYMAMSPMKFVPDSVLVYGNPTRVDGISGVLTNQINRSDVKRSIRGVARLEAPSGTRLSTETVSYSQDITRYVEIPVSGKVSVRNVPEGKNISVFPDTVSASMRCVFPLLREPERGPQFYVDYADFALSISGKCPVRVDELPVGTISCVLDTEFCTCVENL